jgi:hypothetical protein
MQWVPSPSLRTIVLAVFLLGLPVLAIPWVSQQLDRGLYGEGQKSVPDLVLHSPQRTQVATLQEDVSPARFDQSLIEQEPQRSPDDKRGLDSVVTAPPLLAAPPQFAGRLPASPTGPNVAPVNLEPQAYVQEVRQKLENLGAQYVVLEEIDGGQRYRFAVQMQVSPRMPQVRPFEAVATDPVAAARTVLADVESWRTASNPANPIPPTTLQR